MSIKGIFNLDPSKYKGINRGFNCKYFMNNGTCSFKPKDYLGIFSHECLISFRGECDEWTPNYYLPPEPPKMRIVKC